MAVAGVGAARGAPWTVTEPVIAPCRPQTNGYEPGAANVHSPAHPASLGEVGSGGTAVALGGVVCVQPLGCSCVNTTLCELPPVG